MEPKTERKGLIEVRYNDKGLDEVVATSPDGKMHFHMEKMDHNAWWLRVDIEGQDSVVVNLHSIAGEPFDEVLPTMPRKINGNFTQPEPRILHYDGSTIVSTAEWDQ